MRNIASLTIAGFMTTAIAFGPARVGFGLFLPTFNKYFEISSTQVGLIAGCVFFSFLISLHISVWLDCQFGPRRPVTIGALSAAIGMLIVANCDSVLLLTLGLSIAGMSAGLCWTPFNDAAYQTVSPKSQPKLLSGISTGASAGVVMAAIFFLGSIWDITNWRMSWNIFAGVAFVTFILTLCGIPKRHHNFVKSSPKYLNIFNKNMLKIVLTAACFGASNALFLSFAADYIVARGGLSYIPTNFAPAIMFIIYGIFGLTGLATGYLEEKLGLYKLIALIFLAFALSIILVALLPTNWLAVILSASLHGAAVMMISATLSFWSIRLSPKKRTTIFTEILIICAAFNIISSALGGWIADVYSMKMMFLSASLLPLCLGMGFLIFSNRTKNQD